MRKEKFIIRNRWWFIITPLVLSVVAVVLLTKVKINSDLESYFPETMQSKENAQLVEETFGKTEPLMLVFETGDVLNPATLQRIKNLDNELGRMDLFDEVISLFSMKNIKGNDGMMIVDPLIDQMPETETEREKLRERVRGNELAYKTVVSENFRYSLILMQVANGITDEEVMTAVNNVLEKYPGTEKTYISGMPYLRYETNNKITRDLTILLPLGLLIMVLFLFISFREFRGVWLPISVVVVSTLVSMALLPLMNWDLSIIGVLIPIMMIAIANNYGVHFVARYQEINVKQKSWGMNLIVLKTLSHLRKPIFFTGLTTIVGILGLVTHLMIPARQMGIISAIGVGLALALSLTYIPALMSIMKKGKSHRAYSEKKNSVIGAALSGAAAFINRHPHKAIAVFVLALAIAGSGIFMLKVASNNDKVLPKKHPYNQTISIANEHFGGTRFLTVLFEGDMKDPAVLKRIDSYENELKKMPEIGNVNSMATIIKIMSRALNDPGTEGYDKIPENRQAIAQYLLLYSMNGDPSDFENLVDFDYTRGLLNIQFQAGDMKTLNKVIDKIETLTQNDPAKQVIAGFSLTEKEMAESITTGQAYSLIFALVAIFVLLSLIFKSVPAGATGSLPLVFAVICTFGFMGFTGMELNIVTTLLSSISIGVGVDYTIHILWRLKAELARGEPYPAAINTTLRTTGRGIVINAFSVMLGFSVLYFSAFPYLKMFATLIILSLFLCLLCALVLIPAICFIAKPRFLGKAPETTPANNKKLHRKTLNKKQFKEIETT
jgi:hypothetical protein